MLELVAAALEDGWAFVKTDEKLMLLKPPYRPSNLAIVSGEILEKAVICHGFHMLHRTYADWAALIEFLRSELAKARVGFAAISDADLQYELLCDAPLEVVEDYLRRTEVELLPNGECSAAINLLSVLMKVDLVREDPVLQKRTLALLNRSVKELSRIQSERADLAAEGIVGLFPGVSKRYSVQSVAGLMRRIREGHQVFAVGGSKAA